MKTLTSLSKVAFLALALAAVGVTASFAQTPAPATPPAGQTHTSPLTADEQAQLKKAQDAALAADPTLQATQTKLKAQHDALKSQGASASADDKAAFHTQAQDYRTKLRAAELKVDPTLAPVFAKLDAAHKQ